MDRPKVGVGVILFKDGKILLGKRKNSHGEGTWAFPGGHLEYFESLSECAQREVLEETGLEIGNVDFVTATNDIFENENKHYITLFVKTNTFKGVPKVLEPEKNTCWEWFEWDNLPTPLFLPCENLRKTGINPIE